MMAIISSNAKATEPVLIPMVAFRFSPFLAVGATVAFHGIGTNLGSDVSLKVA